MVFLIACETTYAAMTVHKSLGKPTGPMAEREPAQPMAEPMPAQPTQPAQPLQPTVVPTPRDITESCGMAVRFAAADEAAAQAAAESIRETRGFCALYREVQEHRSYRLVCQL